MINGWIIYLISVADRLNSSLIVIGIISILILLVYLLNRLMDEEELNINFIKRILSIIFACLFITTIIPSEKTLYLLTINNYATSEALEDGAKLTKNSIDYIFEKIETLKGDK